MVKLDSKITVQFKIEFLKFGVVFYDLDIKKKVTLIKYFSSPRVTNIYRIRSLHIHMYVSISTYSAFLIIFVYVKLHLVMINK